MPTVLARLDVALDGIDVSASVTAQVGELGPLRALLDGGAPHAVGSLTRLLAEAGPPEFGVVPRLLGALDGAGGALPETPRAELDALLGELGSVVTLQLGGLVGPLLQAADALQRLLDADLVCATAAPPPGVPAPPPPPAPPPGDGASPAVASATATTAALNDALDSLPDPLDVPGVLGWINERLDKPILAELPYGLPTPADVSEPLATLLALDGADADTLRAHIAGALGDAADLVDGIAAEVRTLGAVTDAVAGALPADLAGTVDGIVSALGQLRDAVEAGDAGALGAAAATLDGLAGTYEAHAAAIPDAAEQLPRDARDLAVALGDRAVLAAHALRPGPGLAPVVEQLRDALSADTGPELLAEGLRPLGAGIAWLQDLVRALDLSQITGPLEAASDAVRAVTAGVQSALTGATASVAAALDQAATALDAADPGARVSEAAAALQGALDGLAGAVADALAGAAAALGEVVEAVSDAAGAFDPGALVDDLQDGIGGIADALAAPEVQNALDAVRTALDAAAAQLEGVQFTPVTDAVVAAIDDVERALARIEGQLPAPVALALRAALAALPASLRPLTDALVRELGQLLAAGPQPLLEQVRGGPDQIRARLDAFDPASVAGGELGAAFRGVLAQLEAFRPSTLLAPALAHAGGLRDRLAAEVSAGRLLEPLRQPHAQLTGAVAALDPAALTGPVEQAVADLGRLVREDLGLDAALAGLEDLTSPISNAVEMVRAFRDALDRLRGTTADLAGLGGDVNAWVDGVLAGPVTDDGSIAAAAERLAAAAVAVRRDALVAHAESVTAALRSALDGLDPARRLTAYVAAHRAVPRTALEALPASPERDAALAVLDRLDPVTVAVAAPLRRLAALQSGLREALEALPAALADWDADHHRAGSPLALSAALVADPAVLLAEARADARARVAAPLAAGLQTLEPLGQALGGLVTRVDALLADVDARLGSLVGGPGSLTAIADAIDEAVSRLTSLDLAVVTDGLAALRDRVTAALAALDPAALAPQLDAAFAPVLAAFDPDALLPQAQRDALDQAFDDATAALAALDPEQILGDALGAAFDVAVRPLADAFDLSGILADITERLGTLEGDLRAELARVEDAYQRLRRTADGLDLSVEVELDLAVPSPF